MHRFTPNYGIVATVTFTDNPEVFHIEFLQGIQWLPPVLLQSITMPKCPTAEDSFKEDLNRQIESWHDDWITAGEPWGQSGQTQMLYVWVADTVSRQPEQYMVYILRENM